MWSQNQHKRKELSMNRSVIIAVLFALVVLLGVTGIADTYRMKEQMSELLLSAEVAAIAGDIERATTEAETIQKKWDKNEKRLLLYMKHNELDSIKQAIAELKFLIQYRDTAEFCAKINEALTMIEHIWESELPTLKNIL